jgi:ubiquinone/menaquinone biosynthesis C-methylase UbiE
MKRSDTQAYTNQRFDAEAARYESQRGHGFADEAERAAWIDDIRAAITLSPGVKVLDVGAGTGVLTRLFAEWGCSVVGLDPSQGMLAEARKRLPESFAAMVEFRQGDTTDATLFSAETFDWIVSRQVACLLPDPLQAFANWRRWLKSYGQVLVIDGLWSRQSWSHDELVDSLPLSCLQTRSTLVYLLEKAGFAVTDCLWLERANRCLEATDQQQRYLVLARKMS